MKKWLSNSVTLFLIAAAVALFLMDGFGANPLADGTVAPEFELDKLGGGRVSSASMKGEVVMVDFWATWCPPCRAEMPWLVKLGDEYAAKGVHFVAVSEDDQRPLVGVYAKEKVPGLERYAVFSDGVVGGRFKVAALPTLYVIGRDGKIVAGAQGETSEWRVRRWLNAALEAK